jgi:adenosylhomocysteine nucleosidase
MAILILTALPEERAAIEEHMGSRVRDGRLKILECGVGSLAAAMRLTAHCERERPEAVLLTGVAGALVEGLNIGDLVVAERVYQHDSVSTFPTGTFWMNPGRFIVDPKEEVSNERAGWACDVGLVDRFRSSFADGSVHFGVVASGAEFVASYDRKKAIAGHPPRPLCVEMEAAGVAAVCDEYKIPFLVAKTIADRLNPDHSIATDFSRCLKMASAHAALLVSKVFAD